MMRNPLRNTLLSLLLSVAVLPLAVPVDAQDSTAQFVSLRGTIIDAPGKYVLRSNMTVIPTGPVGIVITGNGVTLDLNGNEIRGPGGKRGTGIMIDRASGVKVVNGQLANLAFGVIVNESSNVVLQDLCIRGEGLPIVELPPETGIMLLHSKNVSIEKNAIYNTGLGVFVRGGGSWGNRVGNNTITANTNGAIGVCYNPAGDDPEGPRGDLVHNNLNWGIYLTQVTPTSCGRQKQHFQCRR